MARVTGPLFSFSASGSLAKSLVFARWKGRDYVRRLVIPANPQAPMQLAVRAALRMISQLWAGMGAVDKASWDELAAADNISPFDAFMRYNLLRFRSALGFAINYPYTDAGTPPTAPTTTATGGIRQATLSIADGGTPPDMAWMVHRSTVTGFTPSWANVVYMPHYVGSPTIFVDTPLVAGTYYYRIRGLSYDATWGTLEVERSAIVT